MSDTVIRVENLGKKYTIGQQQGESYTALRDVITNGAKGLAGRLRGGKSKGQDSASEDFWALKDVSFEIKQGDRVGIIGRNGAGKSTLLKILSRITEPTEGRIKIKGRIASLLEVGTGFHPELTGRENIYLNGAILGMEKTEIHRKFDEIVDFSEVEKFLDTPVKRYSSGMYVRLAFAVAAHLDPEVLVVDEVLAVGDAQFQKKCLGKMKNVSQQGRTVLFVSHNMGAIRHLCDSAILLQEGALISRGLSEQVINEYLRSPSEHDSVGSFEGRDSVRLSGLSLYDIKYKSKTSVLVFGGDYLLNLDLEIGSNNQLREAVVFLKVFSMSGILVSSVCSLEEGLEPFILKDATRLSFHLPHLQLFPGQYFISVFVYRFNDSVPYISAENVTSFEVQPAVVEGASWAYRNSHGVTRISKGVDIQPTDLVLLGNNKSSSVKLA